MGGRITLLALVASVVACGWGAWTEGYRVNLTPSMRRGIWRLAADAPRVGDVVAVDPFALSPDVRKIAVERGYLPRTFWGGAIPLLKRVAADAGDVVELRAEGLSADGEILPESVVLSLDGAGRPLPHPRYPLTVPRGCVWLVSGARGFDSRYVGPVRTSDLLGVATPVLVFP